MLTAHDKTVSLSIPGSLIGPLLAPTSAEPSLLTFSFQTSYYEYSVCQTCGDGSIVEEMFALFEEPFLCKTNYLAQYLATFSPKSS